jgi:hypothetical protein
MFGYTARRIKTVMATEPSPDACGQDRTRMETDGWYIDLNIEVNCNDESFNSYQYTEKSGGCQDQIRVKAYRRRQTRLPGFSENHDFRHGR